MQVCSERYGAPALPLPKCADTASRKHLYFRPLPIAFLGVANPDVAQETCSNLERIPMPSETRMKNNPKPWIGKLCARWRSLPALSPKNLARQRTLIASQRLCVELFERLSRMTFELRRPTTNMQRGFCIWRSARSYYCNSLKSMLPLTRSR